MKIQRITESKYYKLAKSLIKPEDHRLDCVGPDIDPDYKEKILKSWDIIDKLKFLRGNLTRAANRGEYSQIIEVDLDYVYSIGESQDWVCALSGVPLEFTRGGTMWGGKWCNPNSCTIDRIDSSKGYIKGNIQLVTWRINCMKRDLENSEFIEWCTNVAKKHQIIPGFTRLFEI